ncbi:MAG TPA: phosphoribosylformylglycinamidine synthase subunit PurL [Actinomycetota bacterium]|nr:phosphoribosylformylglycinamidine synthase subunit PurL [Actinomycetota bacterium]
MTADLLVHRELGLTDDELDQIRAELGREPTYTELAMFSVMWSEHCSYKSSRLHLTKLPSKGDAILVGPGEGAGIIEVAPGVAVAWKAESHNHPSFVEPFNGAATGVGGIIRDIVSMGARPIALMDSLRFGELDDPRTRYLMDGVVHGISSYGNSVGVPTVGGETAFEDCYADNPLVNVACLGVVEHKLMQGRATGTGNKVLLFGSSTGRDGIGGASVLASAGFDDSSMEKRPSVQVGDPFSEKLLIEASLELVARDLIVGLQDLGAGGISCPASEMAAKAGTGIYLTADDVHLREQEMQPFEIMISESQERMLAIVEPRCVDEALAVCAHWGVPARVIGEVTSSDRLEVDVGGDTVADVPARALADAAPVLDRARQRPEWIDDLQASPNGGDPPEDLAGALSTLLASPSICSKRWVWEQYDHMIFLGTIGPPGGDAAVIRLPDREVAVAISTDGPGRYCYLDPCDGARLAVAESARNVAAAGARPVAITNCLNLGNPEDPEVMWQFGEVIRGISDACNALGTPVTGGNVSFYNETKGRPIYPTPVIGMLGVLDSYRTAVGVGFVEEGHQILLLGSTDPGDFGGSEYAKMIHRIVAGTPPKLDLQAERSLHLLLHSAATQGLMASCHDLSHGGAAVALVECAMAAHLGFSVDISDVCPQGEPHSAWFSETPSRAVVSCAEEHVETLAGLAATHRVPLSLIGVTGGSDLDFGPFAIELTTVEEITERALPNTLSASMDR